MRTNIRVVIKAGMGGDTLETVFCGTDEERMRTEFRALVERCRGEGFDMRVSPNGVFAIGPRDPREYRVVDCFWNWEESVDPQPMSEEESAEIYDEGIYGSYGIVDPKTEIPEANRILRGEA